MRRRVNKSHRNLLIIGLCSILLIMGVGYAAFSARLNISGTSEITSVWDVEITGIEKSQVNGNVIEKIDPSYTKDSATFSVGLELPGDYIYYKVAVTNKGTLAAIATLGNLECTNSNAVSCGAYADSNVSNIGTNTDLTNRRLIIGPGETEYYNIWVEYNNDITNNPDIKSIDITLTLTYEQSDVGIIHTTPDKCYTGKVLEDGTLEITDYNESCGSVVVIPEVIDGYTVTRIADGKWDNNLGVMSAFGNKNITSVTMPDTITYVGTMAFRNNQISYLKLSNNLREIGNETFTYNSLTNLVLPDTLIKIQGNAFSNNNLTEINIPSSVTSLAGGVFTRNNVTGEDAFIYGRNSDGSIDYTTLDSYAGKDASNVIIPSSVKTIDYAAFRSVYASYLEIPSTVETISNNAFWYSSMKTIILNEGIITIGNSAFRASALNNIEIPNSVKTIGAYAFSQSKLETVIIGSGIESIGANAFQYQNINGTIYNNITSFTINKKVGSISGAPWGSNATINWIG